MDQSFWTQQIAFLSLHSDAAVSTSHKFDLVWPSKGFLENVHLIVEVAFSLSRRYGKTSYFILFYAPCSQKTNYASGFQES